MLSLILPTYKERESLPILIPRIVGMLEERHFELIIVDDDSPDRTWEVARELSRQFPQVHVIRRVGRRGLSSAVIEGFLAAKGDVFVVMDADGQHDMHILPKLYEAVLAGQDVAIGSRYAEGGSVGTWDERRYALSRIATKLAIRLCRVKVQDPMSGFFAINRGLFQDVVKSLNPKGFKILLDLLVHAPAGIRVREIPFTFATRMHGKSKLSRRVQLEFIEYLYDVTAGRYVPLTFVKYCLVGALGVLVNIAAYAGVSMLLKEGGQLPVFGFRVAVVVSIEIAIIFNFYLNNIWTFAIARLQGRNLVSGFFKYNVACLFGAVANFAVSSYLFLLGWADIAAVVVGAFTGVIWNYTMSKMFAWKS